MDHADNVANGRALGRCYDANPQGPEREATLALRIKQTLGRQLLSQRLELKMERAPTAREHLRNLKLKLPATRIDRGPRHDHDVCSIDQWKLELLVIAPKHDTAHFAGRVFERPVHVTRLHGMVK